MSYIYIFLWVQNLMRVSDNEFGPSSTDSFERFLQNSVSFPFKFQTFRFPFKLFEFVSSIFVVREFLCGFSRGNQIDTEELEWMCLTLWFSHQVILLLYNLIHNNLTIININWLRDAIWRFPIPNRIYKSFLIVLIAFS